MNVLINIINNYEHRLTTDICYHQTGHGSKGCTAHGMPLRKPPSRERNGAQARSVLRIAGDILQARSSSPAGAAPWSVRKRCATRAVRNHDMNLGCKKTSFEEEPGQLHMWYVYTSDILVLLPSQKIMVGLRKTSSFCWSQSSRDNGQTSYELKLP